MHSPVLAEGEGGGAGFEPCKTTANCVTRFLYILLHLPPSVGDMINDGGVVYVGAEIFVKY